ncbi:MAG: DinB family protein [bacterium]
MRIYGVLFGVLALPVWAGPLTQGERDYALSQLHATRKMFLDAAAGLTDAQWRYKPADNRWSIADICAHLVLSEDFMTAELKKRLEAPAGEPRFRRQDDEKLYAAAVGRSQPRSAPQALEPPPTPMSREEAVRRFTEARDRTLDYVRTTQDDLRGRISGEGAMAHDAYQWILYIAAHTERHMAQIKEVMDSPGFPK